MKLLNSCLVLLIHCGVFQKIHGTNLNCHFQDVEFNHKPFYSCGVTSLDNTNNTLVITGYSGVHQEKKTESDVKAIWIRDTNTKYIPRHLGLLFNLTVFNMESAQLVEITSKDFIGMQNLIELALHYNQIEEIPNGVFANNLQLKWIYLHNNKIKFLGSSLFDGLTKLNTVYLFDNLCINKRYEGNTGINELKNEIKMKCTNSNEAPIITTQTPTDAPIITTRKPTDTSIMTTQAPSDAPTVSKLNQTLFKIILITILILYMFNLNK